MATAFSRGPTVGIADINSKQPTFKKPVVTGKFSSHPSRKKKEKNTKQSQDKMHSIPNYYRKNTNQDDK